MDSFQGSYPSVQIQNLLLGLVSLAVIVQNFTQLMGMAVYCRCPRVIVRIL